MACGGSDDDAGEEEHPADETTVKDQDGNSYKTVAINGKTWMAENYRRAVGTYVHAHNSADNDSGYGLLYDDDTVIAGDFCPAGWRLPTQNDFEELLNYVAQHRTSRSDFLALIAKSPAWKDYANQGGDDFGFGALPAGNFMGGDLYLNFGEGAHFWSSSRGTHGDLYELNVHPDNTKVIEAYVGGKAPYFSVRCVKN